MSQAPKSLFERTAKFLISHSDQFLTIRSWKPNFKPSPAFSSSVAVSARLPRLPIEYYDPMALKEIGQAIGPVLRIDTHMAFETHGRFLKISEYVFR